MAHGVYATCLRAVWCKVLFTRQHLGISSDSEVVSNTPCCIDLITCKHIGYCILVTVLSATCRYSVRFFCLLIERSAYKILHFGDELSGLMAQVNAFVPPTPFLEHPGEPVIPFRTWIRIFNNYLLAAFPAKLCDERRQAILLNSLGVEGQRLFYALPPPEPTYEALRALELFFTPKVNVCAERHRFRSRHQLPNESADHYVVSLRELVSLCAFGPLEDEMIRDQLIEGTSSPSIRERLLSLCELTLETALTVARQMESAKKDAVIISTPEANVSVQMTKRNSSQNARRSNDRSVSSQRCYRCGSTSHLANYLKCPVKHAQCRNCRKMGHFAQVRRSVNSQKQSKTVHSLLSARASDADRLYVHVSISSGRVTHVHPDVCLTLALLFLFCLQTYFVDTFRPFSCANQPFRLLRTRKVPCLLWDALPQL
ncbi:hypothetical protein M513_10073 [Trichuris suis]|uniref:Retrotransposon gag domain-containing protein n=1 Tax=Trichuris suis TaxID=68888 RepID=A0A085LVM9_9BILA|nr:hypothetical protein M513_10073 [Trichuris suis]